MRPITDKAEVSIDFPDKTYMGSFSHESGFDVRAEDDAILLKFVRPGDERREVGIHLHYYLLADILCATAEVITDRETLDDAHKAQLRDAADALRTSLGGGRKARRQKKPETPA